MGVNAIDPRNRKDSSCPAKFFTSTMTRFGGCLSPRFEILTGYFNGVGNFSKVIFVVAISRYL